MTRETIKTLDQFNKLRIYLHYKINKLCLKHNFEYIPNNISSNWNSKCVQTQTGKFFYLWFGINTMSFESFCSDDNMYEYYWRFEKEINLYLKNPVH